MESGRGLPDTQGSGMCGTAKWIAGAYLRLR